MSQNVHLLQHYEFHAFHLDRPTYTYTYIHFICSENEVRAKNLTCTDNFQNSQELTNTIIYSASIELKLANYLKWLHARGGLA